MHNNYLDHVVSFIQQCTTVTPTATQNSYANELHDKLCGTAGKFRLLEGTSVIV